MKIILGILGVAVVALLAGIAVSQPGKAAGLGCHISLMAGATSTTSQTSASFKGAQIIDIDSLGSSGTALGGGVGCDVVVDKILLGAFADYMWHNSSFKASSAIGASAISFDLDRQMTVGARTGVLLGDSLAYILAGFTKMSTSGMNGNIATMGISADYSDLTGVVLGGGLETALGKNVKLGIEYRHTKFDDATAAIAGLPTGFVAASTIKPTQDAVFARLTYSLDFFGSTTASMK